MGIKDDKPVIKTRSYKVGGDNIITFPGTKRQEVIDKSETELLNKQKLLRFHFKTIKDTESKLADYQLQLGKAEDSYDELLKPL